MTAAEEDSAMAKLWGAAASYRGQENNHDVRAAEPTSTASIHKEIGSS